MRPGDNRHSTFRHLSTRPDRRPGHRVQTSASVLLTSQPRNHVPARQVKGNVDAVPGADAGQDVNRAGEGAGGRLFHKDASVGDAAAAWSQTAAWAGVLPLPVVQVRPAG